MKACTIFLLFLSFANSTPSTTPKKNKRGADLTQKIKVTSKSDSLFKTAVGDTNIFNETFTGFIEDLVVILNTYNDDIFEDFVYIVDKEIKKYPYKGQNEFKKVLTEKSNLLLQKPVHAKRAVINQIVDMMRLLKRFDNNVKEVLDDIDSLYKNKASEKFRKILTDLKGYSAGYGKTRTKDDFVKTIRKFLKATVFIQTNLNTDVKRKLGKHIETCLKKYKEFFLSSGSTTETATEELFYMTTEKPRIVYKSESKSKLVEKMFDEVTTETRTTGGSITTPGDRLLSKNDLRTSTAQQFFKTHGKKRTATKTYLRNTALPLPGENSSIEIFNKERSKKEKLSHKKRNKFTPTGRSELKKHIHNLRHLELQANILKSINEINRNNKTHKDVGNNGFDDDESKEKKPKYRARERKNFKESSESYEHEAEDQSETIEESDTEDVVEEESDTEEDVETTNTISESEQDLDKSVSTLENDISHSQKMKNKIMDRHSDSKNSNEINESTSAETATEDSIQDTEDNTNETSAQTYSKVIEAFPLLFKGDKLQEGLYPAKLWD